MVSKTFSIRVIQVMNNGAKQVLLSEQQVRENIRNLAREVIERHPDIDSLAIIGIRTGGAYLAARLGELIREMTGASVPTGIIDITLYRDDWTRISQAPLVKKTELSFSVDDRKLLLVDDVLFTGRTVRAAIDALIDYGRPKSVELLVLVDRGGRELPICAQYVAMKREVLPDETINVYLAEESGRDEVVVEQRSQ